jgi:hypothetical protein
MARARETAARQSLARRLQPDVLQTLETLAALDGTTVEALVSEMELDNTTVSVGGFFSGWKASL